MKSPVCYWQVHVSSNVSCCKYKRYWTWKLQLVPPPPDFSKRDPRTDATDLDSIQWSMHKTSHRLLWCPMFGQNLYSKIPETFWTGFDSKVIAGCRLIQPLLVACMLVNASRVYYDICMWTNVISGFLVCIKTSKRGAYCNRTMLSVYNILVCLLNFRLYVVASEVWFTTTFMPFPSLSY